MAEEDFAGGGGAEEIEETQGGGAGGAARSEDGSVFERQVELGGNFEPATAVFQARRKNEREGDEAGVGVAGFDELSGLSDVVADDEFGRGVGGEVERGEDLQCGASVGGRGGICDREFANGGVAHDGGDRLERESGASGPEHEAAGGEDGKAGAFGVAGSDERFGVVAIGGQKNVARGTMTDLGDETAGGAGEEGELDVGRRAGEFRGESVEDVNEIRCGGDGDLGVIDGGGSESREKQ